VAAKKTNAEMISHLLKGGAKGAIAGSLAGPAGAATGAALGAVTAATELMLDGTISRLTTGDDRLANAVRGEAAVALADVAPELNARLQALVEAVDANAAVISNYTAILNLWLGAWERTTDDGKRELCMNALVNALDVQLYREGLSRQLFALFDELSYGELLSLRFVVSGDWCELAGRLPVDEDEDLATLQGNIWGDVVRVGKLEHLGGVSRDAGREQARRMEQVLLKYRPWLGRDVLQKFTESALSEHLSSTFLDTDEWGLHTRGRLWVDSLALRQVAALEARGLVSWREKPPAHMGPDTAVNPIALNGRLVATGMGRRLERFIREQPDRVEPPTPD
jgi:hypothetical protein